MSLFITCFSQLLLSASVVTITYYTLAVPLSLLSHIIIFQPCKSKHLLFTETTVYERTSQSNTGLWLNKSNRTA